MLGLLGKAIRRFEASPLLIVKQLLHRLGSFLLILPYGGRWRNRFDFTLSVLLFRLTVFICLQVISEGSYVLQIITRDDLALFEPIMSFVQVTYVFMREWQAAIVVFLEEFQVVLATSVSFSCLVNHSIEYD